MRELEARHGRRAVLEAIRRALRELRDKILNGEVARISQESLEATIAALAETAAQSSLRMVINATGVIVHTNLGRAPLAREAIQQIAATACGYCNLEYDLEKGERGKRDIHTARLLAELVEAEHAIVVNNNAAAVFLALNTLAEGYEVVISRGELIEIGESFRIPEICVKSGAMLREVGTTNRTRLADYANAINERTRVLLRVHPSNFRIVGFTERPGLEELVELARRHRLVFLEDLGSGCLTGLNRFGMHDEPIACESVRAGVDIVTFSGDKLLGGPQAGILAGKRELLEKIRRNPLFRTMRVDKLVIAALEATLRLYHDDKAHAVPVLRMIQASKEAVAARAARLAESIGVQGGVSVRLEDGESVIGGGSTPGQSLPTKLLAVSHSRLTARDVEALLRHNSPPIIARLERDRVLLDLRTVPEDQDEEIVRAFERLGQR